MSKHVEGLALFLVDQCQPRKLRGGKKEPIECSAIDLVHCHAEGGQTIITHHDISDAVTERVARTLAGKLVLSAQNHAEEFDSVQTYSVQLLWETIAAAEYPMRFGGNLLKGVTESSEPANPTGLVAQAQRHLEAQARTNAMLTSNILMHMSAEITRKDARIEKLESKYFDMLDTMEVLATKQHDRELSSMRENRKQQRIDSGVQTLKLLAPAAINAVCKKFGMPLLGAGGVSVPSTMAMKEWLKSLSEPQLLQILASSSPEQSAALLVAYKELALADENGFQDLAKTESEAKH